MLCSAEGLIDAMVVLTLICLVLLAGAATVSLWWFRRNLAAFVQEFFAECPDLVDGWEEYGRIGDVTPVIRIPIPADVEASSTGLGPRREVTVDADGWILMTQAVRAWARDDRHRECRRRALVWSRHVGLFMMVLYLLALFALVAGFHLWCTL